MAKFCPMCGTNVPDSAMNCSMCGALLNANQGFQQNMNFNQGQPMNNYNNQPMNNGMMYGQPMMNALPTDDLAMASFICGLVGFILCTVVGIPGLICGFISLSNIKDGKVMPNRKGLSIAGIILSILGLCWTAIKLLNFF